MNQNFKSIDYILSDLIKKYNLEETYTIEFIKNNWEKIVNVRISKLVKPIKLEKQVLYLKVKTNYWKEEFEQIKDQIFNEINKNIDLMEIEEIRFI